MLVNFSFQVFLNIVGELHPRSCEKLYTIVMKGVMRSGNDHPSREILLADEASYARSGYDTSGEEFHAIVHQARGQLRSDVRSGLPRIHANQDAGFWFDFQQVFSQGARHSIQRGVVQRVSAWNAANAVRAKEFLSHRGW